MPFTSRPDITQYLSYVLTNLPTDQLKHCSFTIAGDTKVHTLGHCSSLMLNDNVLNQSFDKIVKEYEVKTRKKVEVTYIPILELDVRTASNPQDLVAFLHKIWATVYRCSKTDNHLFPDWDLLSVVDDILAT
jgi:hypothetical protein